MSDVLEALPRLPGTYALILALDAPRTIPVGRLGERSFDAPYYLYAGSALGPGGLAGRLAHHLRPVIRPHWHIDALRRHARIAALWTACDGRRLECAWATAAGRLRGARVVPGFGATDCACTGHLVALSGPPKRSRLRHQLRREPLLALRPCPPIRSYDPAGHRRRVSVRSKDG